MKVALVVPSSKIALINCYAPLNLGSLASYLLQQKPDVQVKIVDGNLVKNVKAELNKFRPDVVGVTATTPEAPFAYVLGDALKEKCVTVMGGVHASALPEEALQHFDCVVVGEGEKALVRIVDDVQRGYRHNRMIVQGEPIENLDYLPMPAYALLNLNVYLKIHHQIMLTTSRGCHFRCPFCHNSFRTSKVRYFSAQRIVSELNYLLLHYKFDTVAFTDDEFLINNKRLQELAVLFKRCGLDKRLKWTCLARANTVDPETLRLARSMNCETISIGIESFCPRILKYLKCGTTTVEANLKALQFGAKSGITVGGTFIFGSPTETLEEMQETLKCIEKLGDLKFAGINTMIPYPGTAVWNYAKKHDLLPENVDYASMMPRLSPRQTYIVDTSVDAEEYNKFLVDAARVCWALTNARTHGLKGFVRSAKYKTWLWMWLFHPFKMVKILKCLVMGGKVQV